jgi:N-acetylated-alpha-linked acidic dipeptidase
MKNAIDLLKKSSDRYSKALASWQAKGSSGSMDRVDADLLKIPRLFLNEKGLPDRPWFKNQVYAPGAYTGYGAKPIAAVREYMDEKRWKDAEEQVPQVSQVIERVAAGITKAAEDLENETGQSHP